MFLLLSLGLARGAWGACPVQPADQVKVVQPTLCPANHQCTNDGPFCTPSQDSHYALNEACSCAPQPTIPNSNSNCGRNAFCKAGSLPPSNWQPSKMQCQPTPFTDPGSDPPGPDTNTACPAIPVGVQGSEFTDANIGGRWVPVAEECQGVTPVFNWIISTCDAVGGLGITSQPPFPYWDRRKLFGAACQVNPYSQVDVRYVAAYQLSSSNSWNLVHDSSVFPEQGQTYANLTNMLQRSYGAMWSTGFFPANTLDKKVTGLQPPGMMFVISSDNFYNGAFYIMNQVILDRGPDHTMPNCNASLNTCWGHTGIAAGEIDLLETPFWDCAYGGPYGNSLCSADGYQKLYTTTGRNTAGGGPLPFASGSLSGGKTSTSFLKPGTIASKPAVVAAVIDAMGVTIYLNPTWNGISASSAADSITALLPTAFEDAMYLPRGCPGKDGQWGYYGTTVPLGTKVSQKTITICSKVGGIGSKHGPPEVQAQCEASQAGCGSLSGSQVTPELIWWDFMQDSGQISDDFFTKGGRMPGNEPTETAESFLV